MVFIRIILFIVALVLGYLMIKYRERIVRTVGKNDLAERYLGMGGTYNMWVILGAIVMVVGTMILLGKLAFVGL